MTYEMKERSLGEILDGAFELCRRHFEVFLRLALCIAVPTTLLAAVLSWLFTGHPDLATEFEAHSQALANAEANPAEAQAAAEVALRGGLAALVAAPFNMAGHVLLSAAMTLLISDAYLGRSLSVTSALRRAFERLWPLMGALALSSLGILLGFLCLIVPGLLLTIRWMFMTQAIVLEGSDARASLGRSHELTRGKAGSLFVLYLMLALFGIVLHVVQGALVPDSVEAVPGLRELLGIVPQILVSPLSAAALTLAYFDARVRNEGFDRQQLAAGLRQGASVSPRA